MLVVPPAFQANLREWIEIPVSRSVAISAYRWCDEWSGGRLSRRAGGAREETAGGRLQVLLGA
jgi:hypothetical protein